MPISSLRRKAERAIHAFRGDNLEEKLILKTAEVARLQNKLSKETAERERAHRRAEEYLNVVKKLQDQRDEWRNMFHEQSRAHQVAQTIMGKIIARTRKVAARAIVELNKYREEKNLPPAGNADDLQPYDGEPCGVAKRYGEKMKRLHDSMPAPLRGPKMMRDVDKSLGFQYLAGNEETESNG